jgi:hypothetical protein
MEYHRYNPHPTGGDASWQNSPGELPRLTIAYLITAMLHGADLELKYWTWTFSHCLVLHNIIPHGDRGIPMVGIGGRAISIANLRMIGCYVYFCPPGRKPSKLEQHVKHRRFLGYTASWTHIYYIDLRTKNVKTTVHARFDEGTSALGRPTPNSRKLMAALGHPLPPEDTDTPIPVECGLVVVKSPFQTIITITVHIRCDSPNLGLQLATGAARACAFIQRIPPGSTCANIQDWKRKYPCHVRLSCSKRGCRPNLRTNG